MASDEHGSPVNLDTMDASASVAPIPEGGVGREEQHCGQGGAEVYTIEVALAGWSSDDRAGNPGVDYSPHKDVTLGSGLGQG